MVDSGERALGGDVADRADMVGLGLVVLLVNVALMLVKIVTGIVGHSQALVADGLESAADIVVSLVTWGGLYISVRPPDEKHPFGHGRVESLAGMFSGVALIVAALVIAAMSVHEILTPHQSPSWFTLPVLVAVVVAKGVLSRRVSVTAERLDSRALEGDAWHHRSDAITSAAAAIGIGIALVGGEAYAPADDWAALVACVVILGNGVRILQKSLHENIDGVVDAQVLQTLREVAEGVGGVCAIEKCMARKSGTQYFAELHVEVDPETTVAEGHLVGHRVKDQLLSRMPALGDVVIHLEPHEPSVICD